MPQFPPVIPDVPQIESTLLDALREGLEILTDIRDEVRATRLAVQESYNEGRLDHADFLELARTQLIEFEDNE